MRGRTGLLELLFNLSRPGGKRKSHECASVVGRLGTLGFVEGTLKVDPVKVKFVPVAVPRKGVVMVAEVVQNVSKPGGVAIDEQRFLVTDFGCVPSVAETGLKVMRSRQSTEKGFKPLTSNVQPNSAIGHVRRTKRESHKDTPVSRSITYATCLVFDFAIQFFPSLRTNRAGVPENSKTIIRDASVENNDDVKHTLNRDRHNKLSGAHFQHC
jgi:hypothetical protein